MGIRDVSGQWTAHQGNDFSVSFDIDQNGGELTGRASYSFLEEPRGFIVQLGRDPIMVVSMEARGTVSDTDFLFEVSWNNGTRGRYSASFEDDGRLVGITVDLQNPNSQASWISSKQFGMQAPEPAAKAERPVRRLGKGSPTRPNVVKPVDPTDYITRVAPTHVTRLPPDIPGG